VTPTSADAAPASVAVADAAERRWAIIVMLVIAMLLAMMVFTGLHWASMPPSRVETIDPRKLHISGEFVENNLGTTLGADGKVMVRLIAQQYSFEPQCLVVPAGMPVTFRATSTDAIHGFVVDKTNANVMLIPGFIATFTTRFDKADEYCGTGHEAMWGRVKVLPAEEFLAKAKSGERMSCVSR
jgi:cytochrome c oxidase subunit 2